MATVSGFCSPALPGLPAAEARLVKGVDGNDLVLGVWFANHLAKQATYPGPHRTPRAAANGNALHAAFIHNDIPKTAGKYRRAICRNVGKVAGQLRIA